MSPKFARVVNVFQAAESGGMQLNNVRRTVMKREIVKIVAASFAPLLLVGCNTGGGTYQTNASDVSLAQYAGKANYPYDAKSEPAVHLFSTIAPDTKITLYNAGDESYSEFEIWVNKLYTLHVRKLEAKSMVVLDPKDLYNSKVAETLAGAPPSTINTIQIFTDGRLLDVQGPILPH